MAQATPRLRASVLVAAFVLTTTAILAAAAPLTRQFPGHLGQALSGLASTVATGAVTVLVVRLDRRRLEDVGAAFAPGSARRVAIGFIVGSFLVAAWACVAALGGHLHWARTTDVPLSAAPMALLAYLFLSCREELAFRGYPLRRLAALYGVLPAQLVVALVFALEHVLGGNSWTNAFVGAGTGALLFGMAALATRGLAVPIGMHAAWNFGRWVLGGWDIPGYWQPVVDPAFQTRVDRFGLAAYVAVMLLATLGFWRVYVAGTHVNGTASPPPIAR